MANQRIRIKLKSYDHNLVDLACSKIVDAAQKWEAKYRDLFLFLRKRNSNRSSRYAQV